MGKTNWQIIDNSFSIISHTFYFILATILLKVLSWNYIFIDYIKNRSIMGYVIFILSFWFSAKTDRCKKCNNLKCKKKLFSINFKDHSYILCIDQKKKERQRNWCESSCVNLSNVLNGNKVCYIKDGHWEL